MTDKAKKGPSPFELPLIALGFGLLITLAFSFLLSSTSKMEKNVINAGIENIESLNITSFENEDAIVTQLKEKGYENISIKTNDDIVFVEARTLALKHNITFLKDGTLVKYNDVVVN